MNSFLKNSYLFPVGLLILLTTQPADSKPIPCGVTCMKGSYCFKEACLPCPKGYFQDESEHQSTQCKPWTYKPFSFHFVIKTPGSQTHDIEWTCQEGYELFRYTPGEYDCRKTVETSTTPLTTIANTAVERYENTSEYNTVTNVTVTTRASPGQNELTNFGTEIILSVFLTLAIIIIIILLCFKFGNRIKVCEKVRSVRKYLQKRVSKGRGCKQYGIQASGDEDDDIDLSQFRPQ